MNTRAPTTVSPLRPARYWRELLIATLALGTLIGLMWLPPIPQDPAYHRFADTRALVGVPNFANVVSNALFLVFGLAGLMWWRRHSLAGAARSWVVFFVGVSAVAFGSGYYHLFPNNATLVWDRLPMTIGFMGLFVALLSEHLNPRLESWLLLPALIIGAASVAWWHFTDDLRFYAWVQFMPLLIIPLVLALFRARFTHRGYLLYGLAAYILAKVAEFYDRELFAATAQMLSGHSLKHLVAAGAPLAVYAMLKRRSALTTR